MTTYVEALCGFAKTTCGSEFCNVRIEAVTLAEAPLQIISDIGNLELPHGLGNSLIAKLEAATAAMSSGNNLSACGNLQAFVNEALAQSGPQPGKAFSDVDAANLLGAATAIVEALNCS